MFAVDCIVKVIEACGEEADLALRKAHFDLSAPRPTQRDFLVSSLADLIRTAFMAATSSINEVRR